ncbi:taurine catabolism dioxygenase [Lophium mytilinum]|uniref:Taurine catabolism dioxygenase n=1 Tax=Lophium mytilinum TaxID=390894 RepID=A0A6A6QL80_9PEZI|nr:taurine catabolism dioxygenase [Lophium mytilinum]
MELSGALSSYAQEELTPSIGTKFAGVQLTEILKDAAQLRDLAITVSRRGVVFFNNQELTVADHKSIAQALGSAVGKPQDSHLHRHVLLNGSGVTLQDIAEAVDDEVSVVSSTDRIRVMRNREHTKSLIPGSHGWHSDTFWEKIPSDYTVLHMLDVPEIGGDTLWASGYAVYEKLSPQWQRMLDGTTALCATKDYDHLRQLMRYDFGGGGRGSPENSGTKLEAIQPVIRTNPVTGWKSVFAAAHAIEHGYIIELTPYENNVVKEYLLKLITHNADLQVRHRWTKNDVAIWDNRSVFHRVNFDFEGYRRAHRVVSIGEKPFFSPNSLSRSDGLARRRAYELEQTTKNATHTEQKSDDSSKRKVETNVIQLPVQRARL